MQSRTDPYVGPRPFEQDDRKIFFGRDQEANELVSLITAHRLVLLYAQSGAGKTSLVKAGLIPLLLEEENFDVLPPARVREQGPISIDSQNIKNIYIFNALVSMSQDKNGGAQDQSLRANVARLSLGEYLKGRKQRSNKADSQIPSTVIFDQFEELFTFYPERWKDRHTFFEQVRDALAENSLLRVVFSMREDFIAELDPYVSILPEKLRTRFRMERLRRKTALWAVTKPLETGDGGRHFAPGVAEELVDNLLKIRIRTQDRIEEVQGEFVEPLQLQVVCRTLWRNLRPGDEMITKEHLTAYGNVDQALTMFYEESIRTTVEKTGFKEGILRKWFERTLITPTGTRGIVFRGDKETGGIPNQVVDELEHQRLVRVELRGGAQWYELTHDRLIETIKASNQKWLMGRSGAEQIRQRLEDKAAAWAHMGRSDDGLLDEVELIEAERWLACPDASELGYSDPLLALIQTSRAVLEEKRQRAQEQQQRIQEQVRNARRLLWLTIALAVVCLTAVIAAVYAYRQKRVADEQKSVAVENEQRALTAQRQAEEEKKRTEQAQQTAQQAQQTAEQAQQTADLQAQVAEEQKMLTQQRDKIIQLEKEAQDLEVIHAYPGALSKYQELLALYKDSDNRRGQANTYMNLGNVSHELANYNFSIACYRKALEIKEKDFGKTHQDVGAILSVLAKVYYDSGNYNDALKCINKALEIYRLNKFKRNHPSVINARMIYDKIMERAG